MKIAEVNSGRASMDAFIAAHSLLIRLIVARYVPAGEREDGYQIACIALYENLHRYRYERNETGFIWTLIRRALTKTICGAAAQKRQSALYIDPVGMDPGRLGFIAPGISMRGEARGSKVIPQYSCNCMDEADDRIYLHNLLGMLDPRFRTTLEARFLNGLSLKETAEVLGIPEGTVKSRESRGLQKLRELASAQGVVAC